MGRLKAAALPDDEASVTVRAARRQGRIEPRDVESLRTVLRALPRAERTALCEVLLPTPETLN